MTGIVIMIVGAAVIAAGVACIYWPAGVIVAGGAIAFAGFTIDNLTPGQRGDGPA